MKLLAEFLNKAKAKKAKIVLPETTDERIIEATKKIIVQEITHIILVGDRDNLQNKFSDYELSKITIYDPVQDSVMTEKLANVLYEKRKNKGMTIEKAIEEVKTKPYYFGALLVNIGEADGMVCGAVCATGETIRATIHCVGLKQGSKLISSFFVMVTPKEEFGIDGTLFFADCGVNPNPNAEELASIAIDTAASFKQLMCREPVVGMLSFSTKGSAKHELVDKVVQATDIVKNARPDLIVDGEFQLDAAIVPAVAIKKAPGSKVAGKANCLIFPDLQAGNIGYKLTERLANAVAIGPIIQGAKKPINDLSRGCSVDDIVYATAITILQIEPEC
ncbi:MAG: phosphate acetyltransferase [Candidatus Margulisbacteria bacterium]|nr:phosphate acetyltransferase [Candidatus Margulisiibacteriota bacterium]